MKVPRKESSRCWPAVAFFFAVVASIDAQTPTPEDAKLLKGHLGSVLMGVFTPDGQLAVTVSSDETVRLWNLETRKEVRNYPGHTGPLFCVALNGNGRTLATGAYDNTVRVWDVPLGQPLVRVKGHEGNTGGLAQSADGRLLITGGDDKTARLWNRNTLAKQTDPKQPAETASLGVRTGPESEVVLTAIRNDGNLIAAGDAGGQIHLLSPFIEGSQGQLGNHAGGITGLVFHSNNQQLISAGQDGLVRVWQLPSQAPRQIPGLTSAVQDLFVLLNQAVAVVATDDGLVRAVDINTGQTVREFPRAEGKTTGIALTPNNTLLAVANDKGQVRFFNFADAAPRGTLAAHEKSVRDVVFHPDNQTLSTAGADGWVRHWKIPDPATTEQAEPLQKWPDTKAGVLAVSPDGTKLFAGTAEGKILQWKLADGKLERTFDAHKGEITALKVLPNGQQLFSGGADKTIKQWNLADGALVRSLEVSDQVRGISITTDSQRFLAALHDGQVELFDVAGSGKLQTFSAAKAPAYAGWLNDNQTLVAGSNDKILRVWKQSALRVFAPHQKPIINLDLFNGGAQVITAASDGKVLMTDINSGQTVRAFEGLTGEVGAVGSRADNQRIAAGTSEGKVFLWNAGDGKLLQTLEISGAVTSLAFSPDNQKLAVATKDKAIAIFGPPLPPMTVQPGKELVLHQTSEVESALTRIVFDRDNRSVWATDDSGQISQWAYASPVQIRQFNHGGPVYGVAISEDGNTVISCSADQTVRIWDVATGQQKSAMSGHQGAVHAVALSPDESLIVSSGADRTVRLWDVAGGRQLKQLATFDETMYAVAISPDGKTVAVGGADRKMHLINLLTGAIERTFEGHTDYIHSVAFNPSGNRLLSYGYAGQLRVWDPTNGKILFEDRIGRIGNFAHYAGDGTRVLLSNGDGTARVFELPAPAR